VEWCTNNADENDKELCQSVGQLVNTEPVNEASGLCWLIPCDDNPSQGDISLLDLSPWELTQYLAIYDYLYISEMLSKRSLEELLVSIAPDESTVLSNPGLRADQIRYWVTLEILNSPSMTARVRWICLFIETSMVLELFAPVC